MKRAHYADGIEEYEHIFVAHMPDDFYRYPLEEQRRQFLAAILAQPGCARPPGVRVEDELIPHPEFSIPIRTYRVSREPAQPCLIFAHGGGFVLGDLECADTLAAEIAAKAAVTVVSVGFRLCPEHGALVPLEDLYRALLDLVARAEHYRIDPRRMGITGDSSGGLMSAALPMLARDRGGPRLAAQFPINPVFDMHRWAALPEPDPQAHFLREMRFFATTYLGPDTERGKGYASPLLADDFSALPPAYIVSPEHDELREDAERYAERLRAAGVPVQLAIEPGLPHGFLRARGLSRAAYAAFERFCAAISTLLAAREPAELQESA